MTDTLPPTAGRRFSLLFRLAGVAGVTILVACLSKAWGACNRPHPPVLATPELLPTASAFPPPLEALKPATPLEPLLAADEPERLAVLEVPETAYHIQRGQPLVLTFNRPMVDPSRVGKALERPAVVFRPPIHAKQVWMRRSVLHIEATPSTWARTRVSTLSLSPDLRSLADESVADFEPKTVVFDASPRYQGRKSERVVPGEAARMFFDGEVQSKQLMSEMLVYEVEGGRRMVPFTLTARARNERGQVPIDLKPHVALEPGSRFAVAMAPILSHGGSQPRVVEFQLTPRPQIEAVGCSPEATTANECESGPKPGRVLDIQESLILLASTDLAPLPQHAIEITPSLSGFGARLENGRRIVVRGDWVPGQTYMIRLRDLADREGHSLARFAPIAVRSEGRPPAVRVTQGRITLERDARAAWRFSAIHADNGELRWASVPVGQEILAALQPSDLLDPIRSSSFATVALPTLAPRARPNRWGEGTFLFANDDAGPAQAVLTIFADKSDASQARSAPAAFFQRTDLGIDALALADGVSVWVTSIAQGSSIEGAEITVANASGDELGRAFTDAQGLAWIDNKDGKDPYSTVGVRATHEKDRAVVVVDPRSSIGPQHLGLAQGERATAVDVPVAVLFTDRGLCRPGETIHAKVVLRTEGATPQAIAYGPVQMRLLGPSGTAPLAIHDTQLSSFGTAAADFPIELGREAGAYRIEVWRDPFDRALGSVGFAVGEYRPPVVRVDLHSADTALANGDPLRAEVHAVYPFGSPVSGTKVDWSWQREPASSTYPSRFEEYTFTSVDSSPRSGMMASGEGVLDADGQFRIDARTLLEVPAHHSGILEVTVHDRSGDTTSARKDFALYPADWEVGVRSMPNWLASGSTLDVQSMVLDHDGIPRAGQKVEARIVREAWHSYWQWARAENNEDEPEDGNYRLRKSKNGKVVYTCRLVSATEPVHCPWRADRPGTYLLEAQTRDAKGRISVASFRVYVAGPNEHPDRDPPGTAIALTPAKHDWEVGQTAELAFESPFPEAQALVRVQRRGIVHTERRNVSAGGSTITFPVTAEMVPGVLVSLSLVRPRTGPPRSDIDLDAPDLRVGSVALSVRPTASPLTVTVEPKARTGADVPIEVTVRDSDNRPVPSEVALYAVDEGTLRLTRYETPDVGASLFPAPSMPFAWENIRRSLASRVEKDLLPAAGGDGSSEAERSRTELRERFEPTPLWIPHLETDALGIAHATLHLPRRPTEYRIMAVAIDDGARTGKAETSFVATEPLVVRTALPTYVTQGDQFDAVAFVHNTTDRVLDVAVTALVDGKPRAPEHLHLAPKSQERIAQPIVASRAPALTWAIHAEADGLTQEVKREIPVDPRGRMVRPEVVGTVSGKPLTLTMPPGVEGFDGDLSLAVASHPLVGFDVALDSLEQGSWASEPVASLLVGLAAYAALDPAKRPTSVRPAELAARAANATTLLARFQTSAGGFGRYSQNDSPDPYLSAYALHALLSAKRAGWSVSAEVLGRTGQWVREQVSAGAYLDSNDGTGRDDLAFALRALAEAGTPDSSRVQALYEQRRVLSPVGLAHLTLAMEPRDGRRQGLVLDAVRKVLASRDDERRTPTMLRWYDHSARTLGTVLEAASSMDPLPAETGQLVSRLLAPMTTGADGAWHSGHEMSHALAGLAAYGARYGDAASRRFRVHVGNTLLTAHEKTATQAFYRIAAHQLRTGAQELRIEADGAAFYSLSGQWIVPLGTEDETARGNSLALHRVLENEAGLPLTSGSHIRLGDLVRVRLFLYSETSAPPFLALRDRFGGGLTPLDRGHDTTAQGSLRTLLGMDDEDDTLDARGYHAMKSIEDLAGRSFDERGAAFQIPQAGTGLREYTYGARATTPGTFVLLPAEITAVYQRGFAARSAAMTLTVDP